ncbi:MAG: LIC_10190 family membrane protein [Spirulinaceae cyanobacterium]
MLYFLGAWLLLTIVCGIMGLGWLNCWRVEGFDRLDDRAMVSLWLGLVTMAIALLTASLFVPLSPGVGIAIALIGVGLALFSPRTRADLTQFKSYINKTWGLIVLAIATLAAALMNMQVRWIDTGLYHYGAIRWLSEYGAVPGVALIHSRLGWASAWFALAAPFNPLMLETQGVATINGFILFLAIAHWWLALRRVVTTRSRFSDLLVFWAYPLILGFILIGRTVIKELPVIWAFINLIISTSPDFAVMLLITLTAWSILVLVQAQKQPGRGNLRGRWIPLVLALGAFAIKPTAFPLLPIAGLFYLCDRPLQWQRWLAAGTIATVFLLPPMAFATITSGCPLSPSRLMCFDLPWTVPLLPEVAKSLGMEEGGWQAWYSSPETGPLSWWDGMKQWAEAQTLLSLLLFLGVLSLIAFGTFLVRQKQFKAFAQNGQLWVLAIAILGWGFLLWRSPLLRFGWGYGVLIPALAIASICHWRWGYLPLPPVFLSPVRKEQKWLSWFFGSWLAAIGLATLLQPELIMPEPLPQVNVAPATINDVRYFYPTEKYPNIDSREMLCWGAPLPCTEYDEPQDNNIRLRKPELGIAGGFVRADYEAED